MPQDHIVIRVRVAKWAIQLLNFAVVLLHHGYLDEKEVAYILRDTVESHRFLGYE